MEVGVWMGERGRRTVGMRLDLHLLEMSVVSAPLLSMKHSAEAFRAC
jgi:hypothetical protein